MHKPTKPKGLYCLQVVLHGQKEIQWRLVQSAIIKTLMCSNPGTPLHSSIVSPTVSWLKYQDRDARSAKIAYHSSAEQLYTPPIFYDSQDMEIMYLLSGQGTPYRFSSQNKLICLVP